MFPDPADVIAPREDSPYEPVEFLKQMFTGAYPSGVVLEYYGLQLVGQHPTDEASIWSVHTADDTYVETLNLEAFRTVSELEELLDEMVAYDPGDREEWVNR